MSVAQSGTTAADVTLSGPDDNVRQTFHAAASACAPSLTENSCALVHNPHVGGKMIPAHVQQHIPARIIGTLPVTGGP